MKAYKSLGYGMLMTRYMLLILVGIFTVWYVGQAVYKMIVIPKSEKIKVQWVENYPGKIISVEDFDIVTKNQNKKFDVFIKEKGVAIIERIDKRSGTLIFAAFKTNPFKYAVKEYRLPDKGIYYNVVVKKNAKGMYEVLYKRDKSAFLLVSIVGLVVVILSWGVIKEGLEKA